MYVYSINSTYVLQPLCLHSPIIHHWITMKDSGQSSQQTLRFKEVGKDEMLLLHFNPDGTLIGYLLPFKGCVISSLPSTEAR